MGVEKELRGLIVGHPTHCESCGVWKFLTIWFVRGRMKQLPRLWMSMKQSQRESRCRSGQTWPIWVAFLLAWPSLAGAILFYSTGDPAHNTTAPTAALTNS